MFCGTEDRHHRLLCRIAELVDDAARDHRARRQCEVDVLDDPAVENLYRLSGFQRPRLTIGHLNVTAFARHDGVAGPWQLGKFVSPARVGGGGPGEATLHRHDVDLRASQRLS